MGLRFCARAFSSCSERGPLFIAVRGPLTVAASLVAEHKLQTRRLSSCGSRAQLLRGMWDLPRPGLEPMSTALAGRFSTTAPPGKPMIFYFLISRNLWDYLVPCYQYVCDKIETHKRFNIPAKITKLFSIKIWNCTNLFITPSSFTLLKPPISSLHRIFPGTVPSGWSTPSPGCFSRSSPIWRSLPHYSTSLCLIFFLDNTNTTSDCFPLHLLV